MNEFETLEQYQNSIKEFNERTRLEFEDFIQKQGSDRNKLQLRCTPFTEKKGGYGSFDLDFGLQIWRHQQSKADELDRIIALRDQQLTEEIALSTKYVGKFDELQKRVDAALKMISISRGFAWGSVSISQLEQALKGGSND